MTIKSKDEMPERFIDLAGPEGNAFCLLGYAQKLAKQLMDSNYLELFEVLACETNISKTVIAVTLTETLKALQREGINISVIDEKRFKELFKLIDSGKTVKESIPELLKSMVSNDDLKVIDIVEKLGLSMLTQKELEDLINYTLAENSQYIEKKGKAAFGLIMNIIMKKARGKVNSKKVTELINQKL